MELRYLLPASEKVLLDYGLSVNNCQTKELKELAIVYLNKLLLKEVNNIQYCTSLKVCCLSNNCITNINALRTCCHLIKLDLHGNQIQQLPDRKFWRELEDLKLLYLHNNGIGNGKSVASLSSCPNLIGLTLFDTPLSLHKHYRHMLVNSIWSLKALDDYVISDEEMIEYWSLPHKFKARNPHLYLNMLPVLRKEICFHDEMKVVKDIITTINHILAHYSPVLVVQRWIRGYLTRKTLGLISPPRRQQKRIHIPHRTSPDEERNILIYTFPTHTFCKDDEKLPIIKQTVKRINCTPASNRVMHITVDLSRLHMDTLQVLNDTEIVYNQRNQIPQSPPPCVRELIKEERKKREIKSKPSLQKDPEEPILEEEEDTQFRLLGLKVAVHESDPWKNMLISRRKSARDIRHSIQQFHSTARTKSEPASCTDPIKKERFCVETSDSVKLLPFCMVDRAYESRQRYDIQVQKNYLVMQKHSNEKQAKCNIEDFLEEKRKRALIKNEKDSFKVHQSVQRNQLSNFKLVEKAKQRYRDFCQEKNQKAAENVLVQKFNTQHTSVTKALLKHDSMMRSDAETKEKYRVLQNGKEEKERQTELAKCLKDCRQLGLQIQTASEKVVLGSLVLHKANDRLLQARTHVATMKGPPVTVKPMFKIPVNQPVSKETHLKHLSV
ncbi:LOW QUALITY PROTEIN: leucine-rich repeat and IQ domain-containing protein 3 [Ascaphus truei]|uniref:LOW QUALITY PROTEIN: leucine-rich repeat and IQ domain-containing protein 3 n=1 Tax=Ascaphus truei TaxID=8439 RepID=UPI003F5A8A88